MSADPLFRPVAPLCPTGEPYRTPAHRAARRLDSALTRIAVATGFGLLAMMLLRVAVAWWSGRL